MLVTIKITEKITTMTKSVLDTETIVELPAREMLAYTFTKIVINQGNLNAQAGFLNLQLGQVNAAEVAVYN